ncbi:unnamed protein product [Hermetia illucens]|uniref:Uncharacterized protein n=1 Tax=Hermetia illucens TaxID=343691 RepID=A0A7R8V457_HERIL|nr:unnamed protein product [Hermetia illucens]
MAEELSENGTNSEYGDRVKQEFFEIYKEIGEKVSEETFSEFSDILKSEEVVVKMGEAVVMFKTLLNLEVLEILKDRFKDSNVPQWRPTGFTAREQVLPLTVKVLRKRADYLEEKLEQQKKVLEGLMPQVEEGRKGIEEHLARLQMFSLHIDQRNEKMDAAEEELTQQLKYAKACRGCPEDFSCGIDGVLYIKEVRSAKIKSRNEAICNNQEANIFHGIKKFTIAEVCSSQYYFD